MVKPRPRSAPQDPSSPGELKDDDAVMFRAAVGDVKPLAPSGRVRARQTAVSKGGTRARIASDRARTTAAADLPLLADSVAAEDVVGGTDALLFRRPGVRDQELRRLRRGLYPIEDEIDLHGLNQAAARDSLAQFLEMNRNAGRRCVRIVHGKGYRSGVRGPVLKIAVNAWLKRHPDVKAFTSARPIDGGTGAVYVLLRA